MLDHVTVGVTNIERSRRFYDAALRPLGLVRIVDFGKDRGTDYGDAPSSLGVEFTVTRETGVKTPIRGTHLCFRAPGRKAVDAFYAAALAAGGRDVGSPGLRPQYHADCYCAFVLDPDGHRIEAVCHAVSTVLYVEWGRLGEIGDLYVLPEHRRNGLARRLVEHAKAWCRAQGCSAVSVTITLAGERRHRLSHFYTRTRLRTVRSNKRLGNTARLIVRSLSRPIHNGLLFDACTGAGIANDHERPHY